MGFDFIGKMGEDGKYHCQCGYCGKPLEFPTPPKKEDNIGAWACSVECWQELEKIRAKVIEKMDKEDRERRK